ncbi:unnamed protein product, partial [Chrysoparadoxa australica]
QIDSRKRNDGGIRFNKAVRLGASKGMELEEVAPGAGSYHIPSTMFKNPSSTFRSPPVVKMSGREKFGSPFGW